MTNRARPAAAAVTLLAAASLAACSTTASSSRAAPASSAAAVKATSSATPDAAASGLGACQALAAWEANGTGSIADNTALQRMFAAVSDSHLSGNFAAWVADVKTGSTAAPVDANQVSGDCAILGVTVLPSSPPSAPAPPQTSAPSLAGKVVATFSGSGIESTPQFTVTDSWKLSYSFDCSNFGSTGNFQVYEYSGSSLDNVLANDLAESKSASTVQYGDAGTRHLEVNSECSWSVKVTDEG